MVARFVLLSTMAGVQIGKKFVETSIGPRDGEKYINSKGHTRYISQAKYATYYVPTTK